MSRVRVVAGLLALVTGTAALAGCTDSSAGPTPTPDPTATGEPSTGSGGVDLTVAAFGDSRRLRAYQAIAGAYDESVPDVQVAVDTYPDADTAAVKVRAALDVGRGPDVFLIDQAYLAQFVEAGHLEPVDALLGERGLAFGDDFQRVALTQFSADARLQCMPAEMSPLVVYYNRFLLPRRALEAEDVQVPESIESWTWEDFLATAAAIADTDGPGGVRGVAMPTDLDTLVALIRSAGGDVVDSVVDPTRTDLASPGAREALTSIATLLAAPRVALSPDDLGDRDAADAFVEGEVGMFIGTRDDLPRLLAADDLRFDLFQLPSLGTTRSVSHMTAWCVNRNSEHLAEAADFVAAAVGETGATIAAESRVMVPTYLPALALESFQNTSEPSDGEIYSAAVRRSTAMPYSVRWVQVRDLVQRRLSRLLSGEFPTEEGLERRMTRLDERTARIFAEG